MKREITMVTGNENKLKEIQKIFENPNIKKEKLELDEIQTLNSLELTQHKAKQAYDILKRPVIIEDTSFEISALNNLPGPFIKFFIDKLGNEAPIILLNNQTNRLAKAITTACYYDGKYIIHAEGIVKGEITQKLSEGEGFGFDFCFIPKGYDKTVAELGSETKNQISWRAKALKELKYALEERALL